MKALTSWAAGLCALLPLAAAADLQTDFTQRMVEHHQFDAQYIEQTLSTANKNQQVLDAIARPWEAKPWYQYYPIFLTEKRIAKGVEFWHQHADTLQRAEQELGVDASIIVAILGVETYYGKIKGNYPVLDSLYTLGFYYPPRATFFRKELEQYFLLSREEGFDMQGLKGSYAGAMGWGQFISSSYRHYAIDFDGDGVRDLINNPVDAIGSVANYFKAHGWQQGQPVAFKTDQLSDGARALAGSDLTYRHDWQYLSQQGVSLSASEQAQLDGKDKAKLFSFELEQGQEYWLGLQNFYVISRYNHSPLYSMAVYQLSQLIEQRKQQSGTEAP